MLKFAASIFGAAAALTVSALPPGISVDHAGVMDVGGLPAAVSVYDSEWKLSTQRPDTVVPEPSYPVPSEKVYELKGVLRIPGSAGFTLQEWVKEQTADTATYSMTMRNPDGIRVQTIAWVLTLPVHQFEGKELKVNGKAVKPGTSQPLYHVTELELVNGDKKIVIKGDFTLVMQDNRKFSVPNYSLRLLFNNNSGVVRETRLDLSITVTPLAMHALNFDKAASGRTGGADAAELLRAHGTNGGKLTFGGIAFQTAYVPKKSGGILNLSGNTVAELPVDGAAGKELYVLHSADDSAARPQILVTCRDGSKERFDLAEHREFSTARPLPRLPNGAVVTADNRSYDGLYFSYFQLKSADPVSIAFSNAGSGNWLVAAATLAEGKTEPASVESAFFITEGKEWAPMEKVKPVVAGSILDFSFLLDAPAGKYGRIIADGAGHFVAEKAKELRFRFLGPNLCFTAQYLDKETAAKLADELARLGFNAVRFHHYDNGLSDPKGNDSTVLDPVKLDQLDYLFHCLKERGIYMTLDLYCSRRFRDGELADAPLRDGYAMKELLPVYAPAQENWKRFVRNFLTHRNPYTKLTWAEDPALFAVSLSNENTTLGRWNGKCNELYLAAYRKYLEKHNLATRENLDARGELLNRFLVELNVELIRNLSGYLRNDIGYEGLITEINYKQNAALAEVRDSLQFVDNHLYWDHPNSLPGRSWSFPFLHNQMSALKAVCWTPRTIMPSRIFGKPFTVTEMNYVFPNRNRAESGPILGAYSALQDWDGMFRFAWSHDDKGVRHESPINRFDIAEDSLSQVAERVTNLMFIRGDVKPASSGIAWPFGESTFQGLTTLNASDFPVDFSILGFYCRIGSLRENKSFPGVKLLKSTKNFMSELTPAEARVVREPVKVSETGEIVYNPSRGTLQVVSPKTESLSFFEGALEGKVLSVKGATPTFQVVTASAMDGKNLAESGKILLFHQSDVTNRHIRFSSESMNAVEHWGSTDPLIRRASAPVSLKLADGEYQVSAISLDGTPKGEVPSRYEAGTLSFTADTAKFGGTMVYLIVKN